MSDETMPGPDLRERIAAAVIDEAKRRTIPPAWPAGPGGSGATMHEIADAVMAVVQPEFDRRATEIAGLEAERDQFKAAAQAETRAANRWMAEANQAEATVARVKALAENMRTWCSPHGIAALYAQRIDEAIEPPEPVGIEADSEAEFAAIIVATLRKHRAEVHPEHNEACGNCAVIKSAPEVLTVNLGDLPAVREFAANLDPRKEPS